MTIYALDGVAPELDDDCWIAPDANVIGNVRVAQGVSVWFGATIRGDNEPITLGDGCNIQENSVLHTDPGYPLHVGAGVTVGHKAMLHGCTIHDGALIGMGAIILNGAVIGKNALIGAGAMITEGKKIPEGALVMGSPGRVVRQLDEKALAGMRRNADHYVENMRRYRGGLVRVENSRG